MDYLPTKLVALSRSTLSGDPFYLFLRSPAKKALLGRFLGADASICLTPDLIVAYSRARMRVRGVVRVQIPNFGHQYSEISLRSSRLFGRKKGSPSSNFCADFQGEHQK